MLLVAGNFDFALAAAALAFEVPGTDADEVEGRRGSLTSPFSVSQFESVGYPGAWFVVEGTVRDEVGS
jgi:hypothetical protein